MASSLNYCNDHKCMDYWMIHDPKNVDQSNGWLVDVDELLVFLKKKYSLLYLADHRDQARGGEVYFRIGREHHQVHGSLAEKPASITFHGDLEDCVEVMLSVQQLYPNERFFFCTNDANEGIFITGRTKEQIISKYNQGVNEVWGQEAEVSR